MTLDLIIREYTTIQRTKRIKYIPPPPHFPIRLPSFSSEVIKTSPIKSKVPNSCSTFVSVWLDYFWPSPWLCPCPWLPTPSSSYFWPPSWATPLRLLPPFPSARPLPSLCNLPCPLPGWGFHLPGILWKKNKNPVFHKYCELSEK